MTSLRLRRSRRVAHVAALLLALGLAGSASAATIFGSGAYTEAADFGIVDATDYELGTVFSSSIAGQVTALRVYLGPVEAANPGTIVGRLWDSSGTLLASETYSGLAAGWNQVALSSPVSISASTSYVVSANTNAGSTGTASYAAGVNGGLGVGYFGSGVTNAFLTATSGVFTTSIGTFPTSGFPATGGGNSYFRDVVVVPEPSTLTLVGLGLIAVASHRTRRG